MSFFEWVLEFDGASRGNPGVAGAGFVLRGRYDERFDFHYFDHQGKKFLGQDVTNNEAEWAALVFGLEHVSLTGTALLNRLSHSPKLTFCFLGYRQTGVALHRRE